MAYAPHRHRRIAPPEISNELFLLIYTTPEDTSARAVLFMDSMSSLRNRISELFLFLLHHHLRRRRRRLVFFFRGHPTDDDDHFMSERSEKVSRVSFWLYAKNACQ